MSDLLSQDEINALLQGVDDGDIETETDEHQDRGSAKLRFQQPRTHCPAAHTHFGND